MLVINEVQDNKIFFYILIKVSEFEDSHIR